MKFITKYKYELVIFMISICMSMHWIFSGIDLSTTGDAGFHWNRVQNMIGCIKDGNIPFFFYNDAKGVGYGSSFFYGQLTLYPFLPFALLGWKQFFFAYIGCAFLLTYYGACKLCKRFTNNYKSISFVYCIGTFNIYMFSSLLMWVNNLAVAISFFCIAYAIDFFRDHKSPIPTSLLFFAIFGTHSITTFLTFICIFLVFIFYFNIKRLKDYAIFTLLNVSLCSYFILNYIYHIDGLTTDNWVKIINKFSNNMSVSTFVKLVSLGFPIFGGGEMMIFSNGKNGMTQMSIIPFIVSLYTLLYNKKKQISKREKSVIIMYTIGTIVSIRYIWAYLAEKSIIQFPVRYTPYIALAFLIVCMRNNLNVILKKLLILSCILNAFLYISFSSVFFDYKSDNELANSFANYEYAGKNFIPYSGEFTYMSTHVYDEHKNEYIYRLDKDKLIVSIPKGDISITMPKLWYNGYKLYDSEYNEISIVKSGHLNFCRAYIPKDVKGELILVYEHPLYLKIACIFCILLAIILTAFDMKIRNKK